MEGRTLNMYVYSIKNECIMSYHSINFCDHYCDVFNTLALCLLQNYNQPLFLTITSTQYFKLVLLVPRNGSNFGNTCI